MYFIWTGVSIHSLTIDWVSLSLIGFGCAHTQGLVVAGLADIARPAEKLSVMQSGALAATGKPPIHAGWCVCVSVCVSVCVCVCECVSECV